MGTKQQRLRERGIAGLATMCAELQLQIGGGGGGSAALGGDAGRFIDADGDEGMVTEEAEQINERNYNGGINNEFNRGIVDVGNEMSANGRGRGGASTGGASAGPGLSADAAWKRLRKHLEKYEVFPKKNDNDNSISETAPGACAAGGYGLRVIATNSILGVHSNIRPPLWLLEPFFPPKTDLSAPRSSAASGGNSADVAGLLRAYMKNGRVEDAGVLAVKYLDRYVESVPSVAFPRPAAVFLPHALLEELVTRLPSVAPVRKNLEASLSKVQAAAARQTQVLEEIYA